MPVSSVHSLLEWAGQGWPSMKLTPVEMARFYAMFTDVQTYFDQRLYAYAWRSLREIQQGLPSAEPGPAPDESSEAMGPPPGGRSG